MPQYETEIWPFVQARWYTPVAMREVRVVVVHDMEFPERTDSAEVIAHDFATRPATQKSSAHICVDADSIVQCVHDHDVAYAAPGCNNDGIHIELAGFGKQTQEEWLDGYGMQLLGRGADATAQYCLKYGIPVVHLTNEQLAAHAKGIVGHYQVSAVYKGSDHTDPGPHFPWDIFMALVQAAYDKRK